MVYQFKEHIPVIHESAFIHPQSAVDWKTEGTKVYQQLTEDMKKEWKVCEPLRKAPDENADRDFGYKTWNETRKEM
jgi:hypothetical protein